MPVRLAARTAFGKRCASFSPRRIGHGVRSIEDPALVEHLIRERIHLEVCPTSNLQTGIKQEFAEHAVDELYRAGVPLSISTDTRTITNITLTEEYRNLEQHFGWTRGGSRGVQPGGHRCGVRPGIHEERIARAAAARQPGYGFLQMKFAASSVLPLPL